jgi:hypothetical protein
LKKQIVAVPLTEPVSPPLRAYFLLRDKLPALGSDCIEAGDEFPNLLGLSLGTPTLGEVC